MKAIILAAGRGSRMRALTESKPKGLACLAGKPLLYYQSKSLLAGGADEIGIVTGYLAESTAPFGNIQFHNPAWETTNMVRSLMCADEFLRGDTCLISYSDIFYTAETVAALAETSADIAISYDKNWLFLWQARNEDPLSDAETFRCTEEGYLIDIGGKPDFLAAVQGQYMGLLKFTPKGWAVISHYLQQIDTQKLHMTGLLSHMLHHGEKIKCIPAVGAWGEVDTASDLALYESWIKQGLLNMDALA